MPFRPPDKTVRCRNYNDLGWPRINPQKVRDGESSPLGCRFGHKCHYAHPNEPEWETAQLAYEIPAKMFPDGVVPRTPTPPSERLRRLQKYEAERERVRARPRTPTREEPLVKQEYTSPKLSMAATRAVAAAARDRHPSAGASSSSASASERQRERDAGANGSFDGDNRQRRVDPGSGRGPVDDKSPTDSRERDMARPMRDYDDRERQRERERELERERRRRHHEHSRARDYPYGPYRGDSRSEHDRSRSRQGPETPPLPPPLSATSSASFTLDDRSGARPQRSPSRDPRPRPGMVKVKSNSPAAPVPPPHTPTQTTAVAPASAVPLTLNLKRPSSPLLDLPRAPSAPSAPSAKLEPKSEDVPMSAMSAPNYASTPTSTTFASMPPPPPASAPVLPLFLDSPQKDPPMQREKLPLEERAKMWERRVELLADALSARAAVKRSLEDVGYLTSLRGSSRYAAEGAARQNIDTALAATEMQLKEAETRAEETQRRLQELDFWPVTRRLGDAVLPLSGAAARMLNAGAASPRNASGALGTAFGAGMATGAGNGGSANAKAEPPQDWEEEYDNVKQNVSDLHDAVRRLDRQLQEVATFVKARTRGAAVGSHPPTPSVASATAMDWEPAVAREAKRRRTGEEGGYDVGVGAAGEDPLDAMSAARMKRRIEALEAQCAELENLYVQAESAATDEIAARVEAALDAARERGEVFTPAGVGGGSRNDADEEEGAVSGDEGGSDGKRKEKERTKPGEDVDAKLEALQAGFAEVNAEVEELTGTVTSIVELAGELRSAHEAYEAEREQMARERAEIRAVMADSRARTDALQAALQRNVAETNALRTAFAHAALPTSPAPLARSAEEIARTVLPHVLEAVRADVSGMFPGARAELLTVLRKETPAYEAVLGQVEKVLKLPEVLACVEQLPGGIAGNLPGVNGVGNASGNANGNGHVGAGAGVGADKRIQQVNGLPPKPKV